MRYRRVEWWATIVQFGGTIMFNISTFTAMLDNLSPRQEEVLVWAPDALGASAFLLASLLAYSEVCHRLLCVRDRTVSWWIGATNLLGSVAFGFAAAAAIILPTTGEPANITIVNVGTLVGAVLFFVGAYLLVPESKQANAAESVARSVSS